jgi:hypothetical protein
MTARWEEVLDVQLDLFRSLESDAGREYVNGFAESVAREDDGGDGPGSVYRNLPERLAAMTFNADPVYVEPDMMTVWEASISGFQPEPLQPTDFITPAGFLVLPRPFYINDIHGKPTSFRAVLWHPQQMTIHAEGVVERTPEEARLKGSPGSISMPVQRRTDKTFSTTGIVIAMFHHANDVDAYTTPQDRGRGLMVSHLMPWAYGTSYTEEDPRSIIRPVQALWRLMMQTIAVRDPMRATSAFRRRWERASWPEKKVTVVRLRRPAQEREKSDDPKSVDWTHRWIVGGHWRNQFYPSIGVHRQIWISPYVKGPDELPLEVKKVRVFEFVR